MYSRRSSHTGRIVAASPSPGWVDVRPAFLLS
jgi:hypothetical protein